MVSENALALRYPKQFIVQQNGSTATSEVIDSVTYIKQTQHHGMPVAPRKFRQVARVEFHATIRNLGGADITGARMRVWAAAPSPAGDPTQPTIRNIPPGTGSVSGDHDISSITTRLYSKRGAPIDIPPGGGGEESVVSVFFDVFDADSADFFQAWNFPSDPDDYIQFNAAIETTGGFTSAIIFTFGMTVTMAPSPQNDCATYVALHPPQANITASGPVDFDSDKAATDQFRGAWRFLFDATEWDGIESAHLLIQYGTGANANGQTYRFCELTSEGQGGGSSTVLLEESFNPNLQEHGYYRTADLAPLLESGKQYCFEWRNDNVIATASGGFTPNVACHLEIVQRGCTKTKVFFEVGVELSRASTGMRVTDNIPTIFGDNGLIDPVWFANIPDELFTKRNGIGGMCHELPVLNNKMQIMANSNLAEDQNTPTGETMTTSVIFQHACTPCNETPEWRYQSLELDPDSDPLNFAGKRKLIARIADPPAGSGATFTHPGHMALEYAHAVPNTELLDLGALFPVGEFNPEGCASTSAGLGDPGVLVITNGSTIPKKFDPVAGTIDDAGVPTPFKDEFPSGAAITIESTAFSPDGGINPGVYEYRYTLRNCCTGKESDPNPDTFIVDSATAGASPAARHNISFVDIRIPGDPQICEICIYRTVKDGNFPIMAKVGCIDVNANPAVFVDETPDSELDFAADPLALLNAPMPCVPVVVAYRNRLFGFGDIPQLAPAGTVTVTSGSNIVQGDENVEWDRCLEGKFITVQGDCTAYEIDKVMPPVAGVSPAINRLLLTNEYEGNSDTGLTYTICGRQNRLYFSEPLEPECWPVINFLDIEPGDGDKLIAGASNFDALVLCKKNKTYILRFSENPLVEVIVPSRVSTDIGCIAPRSMAQVENGTVWLSDRGIAMFDGRGVVHIPASDRFNEMLIDPDNANYVRRDAQGRVIDAVGVFYPKREQYLLLLPTVKTQRGANVMLVWDTSLDNITLFEFCQEFQSMVVALDGDGNQRVYLGDTNGFVWIFDIGNTDGVGFPNATGTVRGKVSRAGLDQGASFLDDDNASFVTGGLPQLAALSGVAGLTPAFGVSPDESGDLGIAGACVFTRSKDAALDDPWVVRTAYAASDTRVYVTPGWGADQPSEGDDYMLGAIEFRAVFKPQNLGTDDMLKRDWGQVVTFVPEAVSSQLRVELLPDFASVDDDELTVKNSEGEVGDGRTFDLSFQKGRLTRPVGRRVYNFMQVKLTNFAPEEPIRLLNHALRSNPRTQ